MLKAIARLFGSRKKPRTPSMRPPAADNPALDALLAHAEAVLHAGDADQAEQQLKQLLHAYPDTPKAHYLIGRILRARNRLEEACDSYLLAAAFMPDWWTPHYELGLVQMDQGQF